MLSTASTRKLTTARAWVPFAPLSTLRKSAYSTYTLRLGHHHHHQNHYNPPPHHHHQSAWSSYGHHEPPPVPQDPQELRPDALRCLRCPSLPTAGRLNQDAQYVRFHLKKYSFSSDMSKRQTVSSHDKINVKVFANAREAIKTGESWFSQGKDMDEIV